MRLMPKLYFWIAIYLFQTDLFLSKFIIIDFDIDIAVFPILDGDVPRSISYGVFISILIRVASVTGHVTDINACDII